MKRVATACVACAKRRKGCVTSKAWKKKMFELFPFIGDVGEYRSLAFYYIVFSLYQLYLRRPAHLNVS